MSIELLRTRCLTRPDDSMKSLCRRSKRIYDMDSQSVHDIQQYMFSICCSMLLGVVLVLN